MEIVVKIPDDMIKLLKQGNFGAKYNIYELVGCLMNGTPLPKHHGRLGDLDKLYTEMNNGIKAGLYEDGYEHYGHINDMDDCLECVEYADTIIEAS